MHGSVPISSRKRSAAIRSGHVGDEQVLADAEPALLLQVAGDELGRPRRDGRAQDDQLLRAHERQQVVEHGADVAHVDLDVRQRRRAEREHDRVGLGGVGGARGQLDVDARQQLVDARLLERHPALAQRGEPLLVLVDPEHRQARVREADGEREADPAESDDGDVVAHSAARG